MNEIFKKFLLTGDKFMPEIHLRQPGLTYSACETFTKNKEINQKFKETRDSRYIYQKELDKAYEDLTRRTASDKILRDEAFNITKNPKYDGYEQRLFVWNRKAN